MKYNVTTIFRKLNPTELKLAKIKPYKIGEPGKINSFLFRERLIVEKEMNAAILNEQQFVFGKRT